LGTVRRTHANQGEHEESLGTVRYTIVVPLEEPRLSLLVRRGPA